MGSEMCIRDRIAPLQLQGFEAVLEGAAQALAIKPAAKTADEYGRAWVLTGGEDHALLATFPADATLPRAFKRIGVVIDAVPGAPVLLGQQPIGAGGWDSVTG